MKEHEMQLPMFGCDAQHEDFFMYTPANKDYYFLLKMKFDELFMTTLLSKLKAKFVKSFVPEIVSGRSKGIERDR